MPPAELALRSIRMTRTFVSRIHSYIAKRVDGMLLPIEKSTPPHQYFHNDRASYSSGGISRAVICSLGVRGSDGTCTKRYEDVTSSVVFCTGRSAREFRAT